MKKLTLLLTAALMWLCAFAQTEYVFTEASELTLTGKVFQDTPNPYERMDFTRFSGWTDKDIDLLQMSSGIIVSFRTDSPAIAVKPEFNAISGANTSGFACRGFELYIRKDGSWLWAGVTAFSRKADPADITERVLVENMDGSMKECILYLPTYSKLKSVKIGILPGTTIEKGSEPFRHRICLHGSSYMHGSSTGTAGQTVPGFLSRMTGLQFCSLGVSGDCRMQPQFAAALKEADVEAFVFDAFSNGSDKTIEKSLFRFIETIQEGQPGKPLIFMKSIWREKNNFNGEVRKSEQLKMAKADSLMKLAVKRYKDVYYIESSNATDPLHNTSVDGTHPSDHGYYLWAESVKKPILKILRKYGIK